MDARCSSKLFSNPEDYRRRCRRQASDPDSLLKFVAMILTPHVIPGLAKSPATSARISAKISMKPGTNSGADSYVFGFTSTSARAEQELIVETLRVVVQEHKTGNAASTPNGVAVASPAPQSAAMAMASTLASSSSAPGSGNDGKDAVSDAELLSDVKLQQSLLGKDPSLRQRFEESLRKVKATEVIPLTQFARQFWTPRLHLLRAHSVERSQHQGTYNVLSEVKMKRNNEGKLTLSLSKEQIHVIFEQYPMLIAIYNELVPVPIKDGTYFWSEFFASKLFKRLKGEAITPQDAENKYLDKYLDFDEANDRAKHFQTAYIPRFFDLEGNEQDHPETQGNKPDKTMYIPKKNRQALLRVINSMSEKMMANVAPFDKESMNAPAGMDEATYEELRLKDLQANDPDSRLLLNISNDQRLFQQDPSVVKRPKLSTSPKDVIMDLREDVSNNAGDVLQFDDSARHQAVVSSKLIMKSVRQRMSLMVTPSESELGLSKPILNSITMTNNTTNEFLHYFWTAYLSGDEARAGELAKLVEALDKSLDRIDIVAKEAETERTAKRDEMKRKAEDFQRRTGRKMKIPKITDGGQDAVKRLVKATEDAIKFAESEYHKAVMEQTAQLSAATT